MIFLEAKNKTNIESKKKEKRKKKKEKRKMAE